MKVRTFLAMALVLSFVLGGVAMAASVDPVRMDLVIGNAATECGQVGSYLYYCKIDNWEGDMNGVYLCPLSLGDFGDNTITISESDGTYFGWSAVNPIGAVIVKGGTAANVFYYDPQAYADSALYSPLNPGGQQAAVSHVSFCWNPEPVVCEWIGETAWAAGTRYVQKGNWATYTPYVADNTVILYAGQTMEAGTVHFSPVVDGKVTISITLNEGFRLEDVEESVKIQGYDAPPPAGNPEPGHFTTYKGEELVVTVGAFAYYGVHLDVERESCE